MQELWHKVLHHRVLILLVLSAFLLRAAYLIQGVVPFAFDHGKDSLAIMDMVLNLSPKMVGPWTSIQGLYTGPGWYYLLAPFYLLFGFNPLAGAWTMIILILVQVVLAYKFLGKYEAVIITFAPLWMIMSRSAWNPYPITLLSLVMIILFLKTKEKNLLTHRNGFILGITASFGFHFCAAYAIFYPIVILQALLFLKVRSSFKSLLTTGIGFALPFIPQLIFEIKNNFVQTKAVVSYFTQGEPNSFSLEKIQLVLQTITHETLLGFIPEMTYLGKFAWPIAMLLLIGLSIVLAKNIKHDKQLQNRVLIALAFIAVPVVGFFFLHFNLWYIYAVVPAVVAVVGALLRRSPKMFVGAFITLLVAGQVAWLVHFWQVEQAQLAAERGFLPTQLKTLSIIRQETGDKPFASYHYVRDVYDFTYQYLYFWQALQGQTLPTEFSYQPGETAYLVQKTDLMKLFPPHSGAEPEYIFYVVETPDQATLLQEWWYRQPYSNIVKTISVGDNVTIYKGIP